MARHFVGFCDTPLPLKAAELLGTDLAYWLCFRPKGRVPPVLKYFNAAFTSRSIESPQVQLAQRSAKESSYILAAETTPLQRVE
jgi:hypothetical protein